MRRVVAALQRFVERTAREAKRGSGHGGAEHIERTHGNLEPAPSSPMRCAADTRSSQSAAARADAAR